MFPSFNLLVFTGLMLGQDVLCLPRYTNVGSVDPPTVTTLMIREQSEVHAGSVDPPTTTTLMIKETSEPLMSTITTEPPIVTLAVEPDTTKTPPIDKTNAGSERMTTITLSNGQKKTVPLPFPMPTFIPEDEDH